MHLLARMHLMRAHQNKKVCASLFRVLVEPECSIGPIDVENMVFTKYVWHHFHVFMGPYAFNVGSQKH